MRLAYDVKGDLIEAEKSFKGTFYTCPNCKERVVKAGGDLQQPHFRHKVGGQYKECKLFVENLEQRKDLKLSNEVKVIYIEGMNNLVEGEDYTIVSYEIEDLKRNKVPLLRFCNIDQEKMNEFNKEKIMKTITSKGIKYRALWKICNYPSISNKIFRIENYDVDIDAAIDANFGVLEFCKGKYMGQKFMFDHGMGFFDKRLDNYAQNFRKHKKYEF